MNSHKCLLFTVVLLLIFSAIDAKKKNKQKSPSSRTKTKTKWSSSSDYGPNGGQPVIATEEHGYYVKRTFLPYNATTNTLPATRSPPYLGIPIAWFKCEDGECASSNSGAINGNANALIDGFLCDDDCVEAYEPICGKTPSELAVFYNKCKLNVAKCRTHGLWQEVAYEECKTTYPKEVDYADKKFKSSPFFQQNKTMSALADNNDESKEDSILEVALEALNKIEDKIAAAESSTTEDSGQVNEESTEGSTVSNLVTL